MSQRKAKPKAVPAEPSGLNPLERIALAKAADSFAKDAGKQIPVGLHMVDFTATVRVQGAMDKGADTEVSESIPLKPALAHVLRMAGLPRDAAKVLVENACDLAGHGETDDDIEGRISDIEAATAAAAAKLPKKPRAGSLSAKLKLTEIGGPGLAAAA